MPVLTDTTKPEVDRSHRVLLLIAGHPPPDNVEQHSIYMPVDIAERSAFLSTRMCTLPEHGDTATIELPEVEPAPLKLYAQWLTSDGAPLLLHDNHGPLAQPNHSLLWRDCLDLIQAYTLGSKFGDKGFQHYILGQLNQWLAPRQEPDLELLNYLWESEKENVGYDLLCFAVGHMFQIDLDRARVLVLWMKRLTGERRMMDYIEGIRNSGKRNSERTTEPIVESPISAPLLKKLKNWKGTRKTRSNAMQSTTPPVPPTNREGTPSPWQDELEHLPRPVRIHPKALGSIANTNICAESKGQRTASPRTPPSPRLHPTIQRGLASKIPPRPWKIESKPDDPPEAGRRMPDVSLISNTATMPAIPDEALRQLDFWNDLSDSDIPGPEFWADSFSSGSGPPKDSTGVSRTSLSRTTRKGLPIAMPQHTPTTKQIVQSFRLSRTPTPRRRISRSWSVGSIRSLDKEEPVHKRFAHERPSRGIVSRKPVPERGMDFLEKYPDGQRLQRIISINSRPISLAREGRRREGIGNKMCDREVPDRPGSA